MDVMHVPTWEQQLPPAVGPGLLSCFFERTMLSTVPATQLCTPFFWGTTSPSPRTWADFVSSLWGWAYGSGLTNQSPHSPRLGDWFQDSQAGQPVAARCTAFSLGMLGRILAFSPLGVNYSFLATTRSLMKPPGEEQPRDGGWWLPLEPWNSPINETSLFLNFSVTWTNSSLFLFLKPLELLLKPRAQTELFVWQSGAEYHLGPKTTMLGPSNSPTLLWAVLMAFTCLTKKATSQKKWLQFHPLSPYCLLASTFNQKCLSPFPFIQLLSENAQLWWARELRVGVVYAIGNGFLNGFNGRFLQG